MYDAKMSIGIDLTKKKDESSAVPAHTVCRPQTLDIAAFYIFIGPTYYGELHVVYASGALYSQSSIAVLI